MHKSRNRRFHFNMFEIVLAIAILAFGFASVLGLFPVALRAVRNSQAEGLASNAVNNIYVYYKSYANAIKSQPPKTYFYNDLFDGTDIIRFPDAELGTEVSDFRNSVKSYGNIFLSDLKNSSDPVTDSNLGFQLGMDLFQPQPTEKKPCFFLVLGSSDYKKTEFTAQIIVWKKKVVRIIAGAVSTDKLTYKQAVELNMEVTWPVNIPYTDREKRHYQFIITNLDQTP